MRASVKNAPRSGSRPAGGLRIVCPSRGRRGCTWQGTLRCECAALLRRRCGSTLRVLRRRRGSPHEASLHHGLGRQACSRLEKPWCFEGGCKVGDLLHRPRMCRCGGPDRLTAQTERAVVVAQIGGQIVCEVNRSRLLKLFAVLDKAVQHQKHSRLDR